jgi:hypothetical protein
VDSTSTEIPDDAAMMTIRTVTIEPAHDFVIQLAFWIPRIISDTYIGVWDALCCGNFIHITME